MASAILSGDWRWKGEPGVALDPPVDWDGLCAASRSWSLALHSWEPLATLLTTYDNSGDRATLDFALVLAVDWIERFQSIDDAESPFAWYDLAVGARTYRLAYMLDVIARDPDRDDELASLLFEGLCRHAEALAADERFAAHSNHGLYQVMGQLAVARRFPDVPELAVADGQANARLNTLLDSHFTSEGVHREHSPQYHNLVLTPLRALRRTGLVREPHVDSLREGIEEALAWFVTPAGRFAMFGDTTRQTVVKRNLPDGLASPTLRFALGGGRVGQPPSLRTRGFPESGYVVFRDRWPSGDRDFAKCSYLAQTCAFHSRVHKHADDLSFVWYDRGCDVLTDPGRFGYVGKTEPESDLFAEGFWYADPRRVYVESTRAHNTVGVDGRSIPRRGVQPYGSALAQWGERGEIRFSECRIVHGGVSHTRALLFLPRSWLLVVDYLVDSGGARHDFSQRFHLAPELDLVREGVELDAISAELPSGDRLHAVGLLPQALIEPVRGVEEPRLLGWFSPRDGVLEPQWTFGWRATQVPSHVFASLFCFATAPPSVDSVANEVNADASAARFGWEADGERHLVAFERSLGERFEIEHSSI